MTPIKSPSLIRPQAPPTTVPNCGDITTSIVLNPNVTAPTSPPTVKVIAVTPSSAHALRSHGGVGLVLALLTFHLAFAVDADKFWLAFRLMAGM